MQLYKSQSDMHNGTAVLHYFKPSEYMGQDETSQVSDQ